MKRKSLVLVLLSLLGLVGCTANLQTAVGTYSINGVTHTAAFIEGRGTHGATLSTINCYDKDGKLETNNSFGAGGILSSFLHGGLAGAEMGAGIGAGLAAQGAANVVQNTTGGGAAQSQGTAVKSVNVNKNANAQAQGQGQTQGQFQGQLQNQGQLMQDHPVLSPGTVF
jgi:hypothetical protein